jgi:hypothetical protein
MKRITLLLSVTTVFFLLFPISLIRKGFVAQNQSYPISGDYEIDLFDLWNDGTCYSSSYSITNLSSIDSADTTHYFYIEGSVTPVVT